MNRTAASTNGKSDPHALRDIDEVRLIVARQRLLQEGLSPDDAEFPVRQAELARDLDLKAIGDRVFPHFIAKHLWPGLTGLLVAAVFAAAMSTISTSLNSSATLIMSDYFKRFVSPAATERQSMLVLYAATILWGVLGTGLALLLVRLTESALDIWWTLSGIFGGGMVGLFLLGMISKRARNPEAVTAVLVGLLVIAWMTVSRTYWDLLPNDSIWYQLRSPFHKFMIIVVGSLTILLVGLLLSRLAGRRPASIEKREKP